MNRIVIIMLLTVLSAHGCSDSLEPDSAFPEVRIISPANGSTISDTVTIRAEAEDNEGVQTVDFFLDDQLLGSASNSPFEQEWDTRVSTNGNHTLHCRATDTSGNETSSAEIHVSVSNPYEYTREEFTLTNQYGRELAATIYHVEGSEIGVVMAHSGVLGQDQTALGPLAIDLAEMGFTVLTFDFPGYGRSGGSPAYGFVDRDVRTAISYLENQGYSQLACLGVGLGAIACAKMGTVPGMTGLVLVSCPIDVCCPQILIQPIDMSGIYPKLIIAAADDFAAGRPFAQYAETIYSYCVEPSEINIYSGPYHSMELFHSEHADDLQNRLMSFFNGLLE